MRDLDEQALGEMFPSVWTLELFLHLKRNAGRTFSAEALVRELRASELIVSKSTAQLIRAGLIVEDLDGTVRFGTSSDEMAAFAQRIEIAYARWPDKVRRIIVRGPRDDLSAFAEAFRIWRK